MGLAVLCAALCLSGCSPASEQTFMKPVSIETVRFFPFQVKGFENTYPKRRILVLMPVDARDFKDIAGVGHEPYQGNPAIGVVLGQTGKIDQRLYGPQLVPLTQRAIAESAREAGMVVSTSADALDQALRTHVADYVLTSRITHFWVNKHCGPDIPAGSTWFTGADVALEVAVYKPPFNVPFWQGDSASAYNDPPLPAAGASPEDETEIYDQPGQVLSVALTRAAAGIFKRDSLHTLIVEDSTTHAAKP
ncbi:MAG: hypothetical protein ACREQN_11030 [Candidatus Binataceae bacterium]